MLQHRQDALHRGDLLVVDEDQGILEGDLLSLGVRDEVWGDVAPVELHALHDLQLMLQSLTLRHRDGALLAHLFESLSDHGSNHLVPVRGDGRHLGDFLGRGDGRGTALKVLQHELHAGVDAPLQVHRVHAGDHRLGAFSEDGPRQHRGRGGAIPRQVVRLGRHLLYQGGAHVHELVLEFDGPRHSDAILGDLGRAEALLDDHVPALGAERHRHCVRQAVGATEHRCSGAGTMADVLGRKSASAALRGARGSGGQHGP
mmetsp:Transcript_71416/g.170605  ORF Transcript_71416/g.170605 Transcript_71416/m.170605 type:complete len:258 (+) Transcript_71416:1042-1815(+)